MYGYFFIIIIFKDIYYLVRYDEFVLNSEFDRLQHQKATIDDSKFE